jgi:hypothetical protein
VPDIVINRSIVQCLILSSTVHRHVWSYKPDSALSCSWYSNRHWYAGTPMTLGCAPLVVAPSHRKGKKFFARLLYCSTKILPERKLHICPQPVCCLSYIIEGSEFISLVPCLLVITGCRKLSYCANAACTWSGQTHTHTHTHTQKLHLMRNSAIPKFQRHASGLVHTIMPLWIHSRVLVSTESMSTNRQHTSVVFGFRVRSL